MNRVVHFEIHAEDLNRAARFYSTVFGWQMQAWGGTDEYLLVTTGPEGTPGINGGIVKRRGPAPAEGQAVNAYVCTIEVAKLEEAIAAVEKNGGRITVPKLPIPGVGWLAYAVDTEGNLFGITENDPQAK
jgi:predicted enzyme related to lactoylglutathione lyase